MVNDAKMSGRNRLYFSSYMLVGFDLIAETTFFDKQVLMAFQLTFTKIYNKTWQVTNLLRNKCSGLYEFTINEILHIFFAQMLW